MRDERNFCYIRDTCIVRRGRRNLCGGMRRRLEVRLGPEYKVDGDGDVDRVEGDTDETVPVGRGFGTGIFRVV